MIHGPSNVNYLLLALDECHFLERKFHKIQNISCGLYGTLTYATNRSKNAAKVEQLLSPSSKTNNSALLCKFQAVLERELTSPQDTLRHAY